MWHLFLLFRILTDIDSRKLDEGLIDVVTGIDLPHVTPGNANVCATTIEQIPTCAIPAVHLTASIDSDDVVAISAVDGLQAETS